MTPSPGLRFPLVQLASHHDVQSFSCGNRPGALEIDDYLKVSAFTEQAAGLSSIWVATDSHAERAETFVVGYFTLSPLSIPIGQPVLSMIGLGSVSYRSVGGYLLGRLGVRTNFQGQQLGPALVAAAIKLAKQARDDAGGAFLAVDPKNDGLLAWYERLDFGFARLHPANTTKRRLVLRL